MEFYFNEILSEKHKDVLGSKRVMSEFFGYCRDQAVDNNNRLRVDNLL
jgi:hypothetical protein